MSNLTSASGEASASSGNRNDFQHPYFAPPPQTQPPKKKRNLPGNPDPDAEVVALSPKSLLATNRFICEICSKGFPRDQNLQLHRRGHNLPWKLKQRTSKEVKKKVYVCPEPGCVHHDPSRALGDLTGIKKHFSRKHGEKKWKCDKCSKKYAVQSDWKAHSKTCGTREYRCDCGTLFSRRDSFITHRAFCDALAEENARSLTTTNPLLSSHNQTGSSSSTHLNLHPQIEFNPQLDLQSFSLKKEQQNLIPSNSMSQNLIPPWLGQPPVDLSSPSSIYSTRLDHNQDHHHPLINPLQTHQDNFARNPNNVVPTLPPYQSSLSPHISATALLQKAAQMGATMSSSSNTQGHVPSTVDSDSNVTGNFRLNLPSRDHQEISSTGFGHSGLSSSNYGNKAAAVSSSSLVHDLMNSFSNSASGFDGSNSFEEAFGGILNAKKDNNSNPANLHGTSTTAGAKTSTGGGNNEGLTRDFLGLRAISHSDFLNVAAFGNCISSSDQNLQNQTSQKPWQG